MDAAKSLLDQDIQQAVKPERVELTAARLRAVWTALKDLDPSNTHTPGLQCAPLAIPLSEEIASSRAMFDDIFADLHRTVNSCDSSEILADLQRRGDSLTYGEIKFEGIAAIFRRMREHDFPPPEGSAAFVDIGSGIGNVAIAAALIEPRLAYIKGVEVLPELHRVAEQAKERYCKSITSAHRPLIVFDRGDAARTDWAPQKHVSLVWMHATAFSDELMLDLSKHAEKHMAPGSLVVTVTLRMPSAEFELIDTFEVPCSWGLATAKVHRRIGETGQNMLRAPVGIMDIVEEPGFAALLCTCVAAEDATIAREAAATLGFAARFERTSRQLTEAGAIEPLVRLLQRGTDEHDVDAQGQLVPMHAAAILAVRSIGSHVHGQQCLVAARAPAALKTLAARSTNTAIRTAASSCLADVFLNLP
eukprot:TRINITY_DN59464_c0_g1_i1.p1 TRINITY_DN59464_c0_g1~~TRINITY_DN59464_c0_g1_i1.p1  ORF type:complete len:472 (+),score=77.17 TRINITY_DN59464_c0_g1_i1:161-1417(+)